LLAGQFCLESNNAEQPDMTGYIDTGIYNSGFLKFSLTVSFFEFRIKFDLKLLQAWFKLKIKQTVRGLPLNPYH